MSGQRADREELAAARDLLAELVEIPSPSGSEGQIVARIESLCADWGLASKRVGSETGRDSLVVGTADPDLVIAAHVDTIDAPWGAKARIEGDVVHGLGALDDKGGVVACLLAARALVRAGEDLDGLGVCFAFPVDEERDGAGSRALALALRPRYAIALEATGLATGAAEIGDVEAIVHLYGRSAHGALGELGDNAIDHAVAFINSLPGLGLDDHEHPLLGTSTHEVGSIAAGTGHNTIPDRCSVKIEVKVVPGQGSRTVVAALDALAAEHGGRVQLVEVTEPFETPPDSPLVLGLDAACRSATGCGSEPIGVPAWTDAHNFVAFGGAEAVVFGPGDFATAHTPDEHIDARQVVECAAAFAELARRGWRGQAG
ncbi:MAG TPA: M20/M25/M40 family metallo-hydrolase [Solirubrobacterales bacterium]|nr:M20/M25/M40 family metallo-hydrolase [Solirubrobacterales bacterium]